MSCGDLPSAEPPRALRDLVGPGIIVGIPFLLVLKQPDLGSAIVFVGIFFAMLFWAGVRPRLLFLSELAVDHGQDAVVVHPARRVDLPGLLERLRRPSPAPTKPPSSAASQVQIGACFP